MYNSQGGVSSTGVTRYEYDEDGVRHDVQTDTWFYDSNGRLTALRMNDSNGSTTFLLDAGGPPPRTMHVIICDEHENVIREYDTYPPSYLSPAIIHPFITGPPPSGPPTHDR